MSLRAEIAARLAPFTIFPPDITAMKATLAATRSTAAAVRRTASVRVQPGRRAWRRRSRKRGARYWPRRWVGMLRKLRVRDAVSGGRRVRLGVVVEGRRLWGTRARRGGLALGMNECQRRLELSRVTLIRVEV